MPSYPEEFTLSFRAGFDIIGSYSIDINGLRPFVEASREWVGFPEFVKRARKVAGRGRCTSRSCESPPDSLRAHFDVGISAGLGGGPLSLR